MSRRGRISIDCREMVGSQIMLVLISGEIWKSLSTETPSDVTTSERNVYTSTRSPTKNRSTAYQLQTTRPSLHTFGRALTAVTTTPYPTEICKEPRSESLPAMIIGVILMETYQISLWTLARLPSVHRFYLCCLGNLEKIHTSSMILPCQRNHPAAPPLMRAAKCLHQQKTALQPASPFPALLHRPSQMQQAAHLAHVLTPLLSPLTCHLHLTGSGNQLRIIVWIPANKRNFTQK